MVDSSANNDPKFWGGYIFGSYFLTGEHRQYRIDDGGGEFTRVNINDNFDLKHHTWGAWEIALRYSMLDFNNKAIQGGKENNWTSAINWYLNANLRFSLNYVFAEIEDRFIGSTFIDDANVNIWMTRFQIIF